MNGKEFDKFLKSMGYGNVLTRRGRERL